MTSNDIANCPPPVCDVKTCPQKSCVVKTCPVKICPVKTCPVKTCPKIDLSTPPKKILLVTATPNNTFVDLSWNEPYDGGNNISDYLIQYKKSTDLSNRTDLSSTTTSIKIINLTNDTKYHFRVLSRNIFGLSIPSDIIEVTPVRFNIMLYLKVVGGFIIGIFLLYSVIMLFSNNNGETDNKNDETDNKKDDE